eukprot:5397875-Karenia_brevis.AAC.1
MSTWVTNLGEPKEAIPSQVNPEGPSAMFAVGWHRAYHALEFEEAPQRQTLDTIFGEASTGLWAFIIAGLAASLSVSLELVPPSMIQTSPSELPVTGVAQPAQ